MLVSPAPVPDSEQGYGTKTPTRQGVALLYPFGDPERDGRVAQLIVHKGVHVEPHLRAPGRLVLDRVALAIDSGLVRTDLVGGDLAGGRIDWSEKGWHYTLLAPKP